MSNNDVVGSTGVQFVQSVALDCDGDSLLVRVDRGTSAAASHDNFVGIDAQQVRIFLALQITHVSRYSVSYRFTAYPLKRVLTVVEWCRIGEFGSSGRLTVTH